MSEPPTNGPDFWLMADDTFWAGAPEAIACYVLRGPGPLVKADLGYGANRVQWLVRVDPPVTGHGVTTEHVVVFADEITWQIGDDWGRAGEGALPLFPSVPTDKKHFDSADFVTSHKVVVTTRPDWPYGFPPRQNA